MVVSLLHPSPVQVNQRRAVDSGRKAAIQGLQATHQFLDDPSNQEVVECALRIRAVETAVYELFGKGKLHGTIHTCIGQEFSGAVLSRHLRPADVVTSNHRCHGHFIGATGDWRGLMDEIVGNRDGVCAGIGSSQHLWAKNFISNGQQGGLLPVAAGIALDRKVKGELGVVVSFLGEGTLGEGIVYETLNLDALWELPHVIVCENNFYSQSTAQNSGVAGSIVQRAAAFSIETVAADTWDLGSFDAALADALERARTDHRPTFLALATYRLNPHSKGDDMRDRAEVEWFRERDPATLAIKDYRRFAELYRQFTSEADDYAALALSKPGLRASDYFADQLPRATGEGAVVWHPVDAPQEDARVAQQLNAFYRDWLVRDPGAFFIGEDIGDPYGGAFKIAKGLTTEFAPRVLTTPISEAAITGVGIGLAICGRRAFVEIMFGDFITYAFDQIVNNASKIYHMYNGNLDCPVIIRTPMGGRRGYGPTHSQSLERFLIGIDNCCVLSLNALAPVSIQLTGLNALRCPVILLENKSDYTAKVYDVPSGFELDQTDQTLPTLRIRPVGVPAGVTLLAYGGMARFIANSLVDIFERTDTIPEMIVPTGLHPLHLEPILDSVLQTGLLVVIEEGAGFGSFGAEVIAQAGEGCGRSIRTGRVSGKPTPVPSAPPLEAEALPSIDDICATIERLKETQA